MNLQDFKILDIFHFFAIFIASSSTQGSDRIDSLWFANFWFPKWIKNHKKISIHLTNQNLFWIFDTRGQIILFLILINFDLRFKLIYSFWYVLIMIPRESWFTCESTSNRIKNHRKGNRDSLICESLVDSISNQNRIKVNRESCWSEPCFQKILNFEKFMLVHWNWENSQEIF